MATVPDNNPPAAQKLRPTTVNIETQPSNFESNGNSGSVETLNIGKYYQEQKTAGEEESEKVIPDSETQQSDIQSESNEVPAENGYPAERKRKENPEEEGREEIKGTLHPLWKTSLCSYFRRNSGLCSHGDKCRYAHGEGELRPRPNNSWDPTSERGKKLLKSENGERIEVSDVGPREDVLPSTDASDDSSSDGALDKCLVHLPRKWTSENLKSFLGGQGIIYKTAKKKKGMSVGFVSFATAEQVVKASEELDAKSIGNKHIKIANVLPRSYEKKSKAVALDQRISLATEYSLVNEDPVGDVCSMTVEKYDTVEKENHEQDGLASKTRRARHVVTPLAHMAYTDQLEHKKNSLLQTLKRLTRNARKACPDAVPLPEWILKSREIGGLPCRLEGIIESPLINGYRNKCEFSVGYSLQGKRTVGFMLGNFREGMTAVQEPVDCPNVSTISCKYALFFQEFLQSSNLPVWNRIDNTGFWRQLMVREGRRPHQGADVDNMEAGIAEVMLVVQVCSSGVDYEQMMSEYQRMAQAFAQGASSCSPPMPLTALVVQDHKGISNAAPADCPLFPLPIPSSEDVYSPEDSNATKERIHDYISNLCFCISPTAFFQVNTLAAEKLYSLAGDWAGLGSDTLLFDICCGTGTIGLTLAHRVGMVVGIEMNESAVSDAHKNAEINGIKNCRFVCSKAEDVMSALLREYLHVPDQCDESLHLPESKGTENLKDGENGTNDDNIHNLGAASNPDTLANSNGANMKSECPDDTCCGRLEVSQVVIEGKKLADHTEASTVNASLLNEAESKHASDYDHQVLDSKSLSNDQQSQPPSQGNCILEENGRSSVQMRHFKNVVAIVDPPRVGLHPTVIKALRTHPRLRRLVYISCNPESLVANAIELCTPAADKPEKGKKNGRWRKMSSAGLARHRAKSMPSSEPFRPVRAMAVDLFPHTPHCEMVMLLER